MVKGKRGKTMKRSNDMIILNIFSFVFIGLLGLIAVIPFIILISSSLQPESVILSQGYSFIPRVFSGDAYKYIFSYPEKIIRAYGISIFITVIGTVVSLFLSSMAAYTMYRKDVKYRNKLAFYLYFTTIFSGGLVPVYILISRYLRLKDTLFILILNNLFSVFYTLIIRNYMTGSVPNSLPESAKVDGANDFVIYYKIVLPLLKPVLAAIALFTVLGYWNDWWSPMLYINKENLYPLQFVLYRLLSKSSFAAQLITQGGGIVDIKMPKETLKLAMTVVATGPIVLAYPFAQKYFIQGITMGAVKG